MKVWWSWNTKRPFKYWLMIVVARVEVFLLTPIVEFLSISVHRFSRYALLWDGCISLFFCIILLCIISCSNRNGNVDCADGEGNDDLFIQSSLMCCHLSCEIRFEALRRQRGREGNSKDAAKLFWLYIYFIFDRKDSGHSLLVSGAFRA